MPETETKPALSAEEWSRVDTILRALPNHSDFWHHGPLIERARLQIAAAVESRSWPRTPYPQESEASPPA